MVIRQNGSAREKEVRQSGGYRIHTLANAAGASTGELDHSYQPLLKTPSPQEGMNDARICDA